MSYEATQSYHMTLQKTRECVHRLEKKIQENREQREAFRHEHTERAKTEFEWYNREITQLEAQLADLMNDLRKQEKQEKRQQLKELIRQLYSISETL